MRFVIMAKHPAKGVHRGDAVARGDQLTFFKNEAVCACYQYITIGHQCGEPRPRAGGAFPGLSIIITIGISVLQIVGNCSLRPKDQARRLTGQGAAVHRQFGKVDHVIARRIFVGLRDIGLHNGDGGARAERRFRHINFGRRQNRRANNRGQNTSVCPTPIAEQRDRTAGQNHQPPNAVGPDCRKPKIKPVRNKSDRERVPDIAREHPAAQPFGDNP